MAITVIIPDDVAQQTRLSEVDLRTEIAVYLYEKRRLSMGKARKLAGLDLISFQKELSKRNVYIHYNIEDLEKDIENLKML
jgi:predicted HTH domain antitoxin